MQLKQSSPSSFSGFTLIEVMVSIAVFMLIMGSVLGCWRCVVNGKIIAENAAAAAQRARVGIRAVEDALTTSEISRMSIPYYAFLTDTSGKFAALSVAAHPPPDFPGSGLFGDNVIRRITFDVENVDGTNNLIMNQSPLLEALNDQNTPYPITLARDVSVFMLEFWSVQDSQWEVSFDPTNDFPAMVRVTLGVGHPANNADVPYDLIVRTIAMPCKYH
ncbi:MAG: prepilin-type N-terminal cleavage/methylation domain-containing protein [Limisphaerales bacterium]